MKEKEGFLTDMCKNWAGTFKSFGDYWLFFGGWRSLFGSLYFFVAIITGVLLTYFGQQAHKWHDTGMSILPSLLGFTVAAYAILVAFGDEEFKKTIALYPKEKESSFFLTVNGTFCHFIIVQCITLLYTVIFRTVEPKSVLWQLIGLVLLVYSLLLTIAVALAVLKIAKVYQKLLRNKNLDQSEETPEPATSGDGQQSALPSPKDSGNISMVSPY